MKDLKWQFLLGLLLIALSTGLYYLHFILFHDLHHILIYLLGDIAFIPIEVLLVTIIIHQLLDIRDRREKRQKLNMIVGAFFSEAGTELLTYFSDLDPDLEAIKKELIIDKECTQKRFSDIIKDVKRHKFNVQAKKANLSALANYLRGKRNFFLRLLENQNILEHESFTTLLWAVFHLTEELLSRKDFSALPENDIAHIDNDIRRAYSLLVEQWLDYMMHLKDNYPYLFSLALRTNPFDQTASVEFK